MFAPTNAAFAKVPKATLAELAKNKRLLVKVVEYHVLPGVVPASKVLKLHSAKILEGARVHFSVRGGHAPTSTRHRSSKPTFAPPTA